MFENFTDRARKIVQYAKEETKRLGHEYVGTEHLLLGMAKEASGVAANVLRDLGCSVHKIYCEIEKVVQPGPDINGSDNPPYTPRTKNVFDYAKEEAERLGHNYIGTEHLLLGLLREKEGIATQILANFGIKLEDVKDGILDLLGDNPKTTLDDLVNFVKANAPSGLQQDEQDFEQWAKDLKEEKLTTIFLTWKNPSFVVNVDIKEKIVSIKIPYETDVDKIKTQLAFVEELTVRIKD